MCDPLLIGETQQAPFLDITDKLNRLMTDSTEVEQICVELKMTTRWQSWTEQGEKGSRVNVRPICCVYIKHCCFATFEHLSPLDYL